MGAMVLLFAVPVFVYQPIFGARKQWGIAARSGLSSFTQASIRQQGPSISSTQADIGRIDGTYRIFPLPSALE